MSERTGHVLAFYARHPISRDHILTKLAALRGHLVDVRPEELFAHDQDHYGGLGANAALATAADIRPGKRVVDFCAGLGGPARYYAFRCGADVTGVELAPNRVAGANDLSRLVGLGDRARVIEGDVTKVPLDDGGYDAVVSQEALLHVPDKAKALAEAHRLLKPGGRLAFTDWVVHRALAPEDAAAMWDGLAAQALFGRSDYEAALARIGFRVLAIVDLTEAWGDILAERYAMYRRLRAEAEAAGTPAGDETFYRAYGRLVELVKARALGGARFAAEKPPG